MCRNQKYNVCIVIGHVRVQRYVFSKYNDFQAIKQIFVKKVHGIDRTIL